MRRFYLEKRRSPYRNYVCTDRDLHENVIYFLIIDQEERIRALREKLMRQRFADRIRAEFDDYQCEPGELILRIYAAEATREQMLERLKEYVKAERIVKFGKDESGAGKILPYTGDQMVKEMKKCFEPIDIRGWKNILKL